MFEICSRNNIEYNSGHYVKSHCTRITVREKVTRVSSQIRSFTLNSQRETNLGY